MTLELFESGREPEAYVTVLRNYRSFVKSLMGAPADHDHVAALSQAAGGWSGPVRATIMTEDWCGDSACNVPILASLFDGAGIELRILRGSEHPGLKDYYENGSSHHPGTDHIPVLSIWDGDFNEVVRWVEAPAQIEEKKSGWKAGYPEFVPLQKVRWTDREAGRKFAVLYRKLLDEMITWYRAGMWRETTREIATAAEAAGKVPDRIR